MTVLKSHIGLYTDHYELTMAQGYILEGRAHQRACFDYFFRQNPFGGGYVVFAGLDDVLQLLENVRYDEHDRQYLSSIGFDARFVDSLADFRFHGDVWSVREGEIVFPYEPIVRVEAAMVEAQLIETLILNVLNFESLIATKASRLRHVAGEATLVDFGLRRAQGFGGILASRAAVIGGFDSTSNVYSAHQFGLTSTGTQAHSWIESFENELEAFRAFARTYPDRCVLLVDTYDTVRSGIPNAILVAREMEQRGERLMGIRLDSGDLAYLSTAARRMLDDAGLHYVKIIASNQIDEHIIRSLREQGAPIDAYGVGTRLVTGHPDGALDGIYKLCAVDGDPRLKISESLEKTSLPGIKRVVRFLDAEGYFRGDAVALASEAIPHTIHHPHEIQKKSAMGTFRGEELLQKVMENGCRTGDRQSVTELASYVRTRLRQLPVEHKRFENPHTYKVGITPDLLRLRSEMVDRIRASYAPAETTGGEHT